MYISPGVPLAVPVVVYLREFLLAAPCDGRNFTLSNLSSFLDNTSPQETLLGRCKEVRYHSFAESLKCLVHAIGCGFASVWSTARIFGVAVPSIS